jgi:hypothetical protein
MVIFVSLTIAFLILISMLNKKLTFLFFNEVKLIFLMFYYLFCLNIITMRRSKRVVYFGSQKLGYSNRMEHLFLNLAVSRLIKLLRVKLFRGIGNFLSKNIILSMLRNYMAKFTLIDLLCFAYLIEITS